MLVLGYKNHAIDIGRISGAASDPGPRLFANGLIDDDLDRFPDLLFVVLEHDLLLNFHQAIAPRVFGGFVEMTIHFCRRRIGFEGVSKNAHPFEFVPLSKVHQSLKLFSCFARESSNERGSQHQIWNQLPHAENLLIDLRLIDPTRHSPQHHIIGVLQWHIDIGDDFLGGRNCLQQPIVNVHRIEIHQSDPVETVRLIEFFQQFRQSRFAIHVHAVISRILGDDDQFANAFVGQLLGFGEHVFHRLGGMFAPHFWNGTKRTQSITAFRNLQVGEMLGRNLQAVMV